MSHFNSVFSKAELAQLAMMLEVCAYPKPGNVDRCHDFCDTYLEHFLASVIYVRTVFEQAEAGHGTIGSNILDAVKLTNRHCGGNTHFGAFILLFPLIMGKDIRGADLLISQTSVDDAVLFYEAFSHTNVRVNESDQLDINDPKASDKLREQGMTLYDVMAYSAENDIVAAEWTNGYTLSQHAADLLHRYEGRRDAISYAFLELLASNTDTLIVKKFGLDTALKTREMAKKVVSGEMSLEEMDEHCISKGINPGSLADIMIAGIYIALQGGWKWEC